MASSRACQSPNRIGLLLAGLLMATLPAQQKPSRPKDEAALFAQFSKLRGMSASYTEKKHLSLLAVPLTSSGQLHYMTAPDGKQGRLVRVVKKPEPSKLTITERQLRVADKRGTEVIDLRQSDRVRLFVTSLMRVFQGDREALQAHYHVRYQLDDRHATRWQLRLTPKKAPLDKILKQLALHGDGEKVTQILLVEPNGDRTVTTIEKVDARRTFSAREQLEIFDIPSSGPSKSRQ